jgi:RNA methyltransferase, TrmH family
MRSISSRKSDRVKELIRLHKKSERHAAGLFLAEGPAVVRVALECNPDNVVEVFAADHYVDEFLELGAQVTRCTPEVIDALSGSVSPQGVVALCRIPEVSLEQVCSGRGPIVVLDNISDPGNFGTILRTSDATAAAGCLLFGNCVDPFNDKVVRSSAGSIFRVPIARLGDITDLPPDRHMYILSSHAEVSIDGIEADPASVAWVVGSEAHGVSSDWQAAGGRVTHVRIPMHHGVESLNAAVAASVCLYVGYLNSERQ